MTLLDLIKRNKLIFALIVVGAVGVIAVAVGFGVGFGVFYNKGTSAASSTTAATAATATTNSYSTIGIKI